MRRIAFLAALLAVAASPLDEERIAEAVAAARRADRLALVVFVRGAEMDRRVATLVADPRVGAAVRERTGGSVVRIDIARRPDLADRFDVWGAPTFVLLGPDGREVRRLEGAASAADLEAFIASPPKGEEPPPPPPPRLVPPPPPAEAAATPPPPAPPPSPEPAPPVPSDTPPVTPAPTHPPTTLPQDRYGEGGEALPSPPALSLRRVGDRTEVRGGVTPDRDARYLVQPAEDAILGVRLVGDDPSRDIDLEIHLDEVREGERPAALSQRGGSALEEARAAVAAGRAAVVRAHAYGDDDAGAFRLEAALEPLEEGWAPVPVEAADLPLGGAIRGEVSRAAPDAWYRVRVDGVGVLVVSLEADRLEQDLDLEVRTADGRVVAVSDAEGGVEEALADASRDVWFFVRVHAFDETAGSPFTLRARLDTDRAPPRPLPRAIREIIVGEEVEGEISGEGREAWYRVRTAEAGTLAVELEGGGDHDLDLEVFSERGEPIGRSDAIGPNESIEIEAAEGSAFVLRVYAYGEADSGAYRLRTALRAGAPGGAEALPLGETVTGRLAAGAAEAWYRLDLAAPAMLRVVLRGASDDVDLDLSVHDAEGNLLGSSDGERSEEVVEVEAPAGSVLVRVFPYVPGAAAEFALRAEVTGAPSPVAPAADSPPADAPILAEGDEARGRLGPNGAAWYRIVPAADGMIGVYLRGDGGDVDLVAAAADGTTLGRSASTSPDEALLLRATAGEAIHVKVYAFHASAEVPYVVWWQSIVSR